MNLIPLIFEKTTILGINFGYLKIKSQIMSKYLLIPLLFLYSFSNLIAQTDNTYDDLLELYVDEKYEKLVYKAENYTLNDKTKKDPLPYLYYSMANFKFTQDETLSEKYPKGFKEALKFAAKFVKKDKESAYIDEAEDYFEELRAVAMEDAENQMINEKYTKAKGMYKYLCNIDPSDPGAKIYMSYAVFKMKSVREGQMLLEEGITLLNEASLENLSDNQFTLLKNSIISFVEWEENSDYREQIKQMLEVSKSAFAEEKDFNRAYDSFM